MWWGGKKHRVGVLCDRIPSRALGGLRQLSTYYAPKPCHDTVSCHPSALPRGVFPILQTKKLKPVEAPSRPHGSQVVALDLKLGLFHTPPVAPAAP